jgi:23S rRNA (pseudouridine1915-N3)-methyltransferase
VIKIIAIGTKMPQWIESGILHYTKQLKHIEIIALKNSNKTKECELLLSKATGVIIALDETGKEYSSMAFAKQLEKWNEYKDVSFVIGGADGLTDTVRTRADAMISLSQMTLPHSMARLVLVEQIYRGIAILNHHPYHREG